MCLRKTHNHTTKQQHFVDNTIMKLLSQNSKMLRTSKHFGVRILNFGIPAFKSITGKVTCPFAGDCVKFCYARKGTYKYKNPSKVYEERYNATLKDDFVEVMSSHITYENPSYVRVHDSGDFYSFKYLKKWIDIANKFPNIRFYSYTNSVKLIKQNSELIPENFDIIFSTSGKQKEYIDVTKDRHAVIFSSLDAMKRDEYVNASEHDLYATRWFNNNIKVGLLKH